MNEEKRFTKFCQETKLVLSELHVAMGKEKLTSPKPKRQGAHIKACRGALRHYIGIIDGAQRVMEYLPEWIAFANLAKLVLSYQPSLPAELDPDSQVTLHSTLGYLKKTLLKAVGTKQTPQLMIFALGEDLEILENWERECRAG